MFKKISLSIALVLFCGIVFSCESSNEEETKTAEDVIDNPDNDTPAPPTPTAEGTIVSLHGQLHVDGNRILDENNQEVQLRGMSFFWSQWIGKYYTPETVAWLKNDWQCTIVRAAMAVEDSEGYITNPEVEKQKIFTVIDAAIAEGIYVIVDWHSHHAEDYQEEAKAFFELAYGLREKEDSEELGLIYSRINNPNLEILEKQISKKKNAN